MKLFTLSLCILLWSSPIGIAKEPYQKMLELCTHLSENHPSILSSKAQLRAAEENARVQIGAYYPNLNLSADQSFTKLSNHTSANPSQKDRDLSLTISQLIWDFGKTNHDIEVALNQIRINQLNLERTRQSILLQGLELCLNYCTTWQQTQFEKISAENFQRQMDLESVKVKKGQGYSTDVLQAEAQLLGAKNRKIQLQASLDNLKSSFRSLFGPQLNIEELSGELIRKNDLEFPQLFKNNQNEAKASGNNELDVQLVSDDNASLSETYENLIKNNPRLLSLKVAIKNQALRKKALVKRRFRPVLSGSVSGELSHRDSISNPFQRETSAAISLDFPFNMGLTSLNEIASLDHSLRSLEHDYLNEKRNLIHTLKSHLIQWESALESASLLKRQVEISRKFLEGAEKERTMGRRSLIDVINGELILIRAKSNLEQSEIQALRSYFRYLNSKGELQISKLSSN